MSFCNNNQPQVVKLSQQASKKSIIQYFDINSSAYIFVFLITIYYIATPFFLYTSVKPDPYFQKLTIMSILSCVSVLLGFHSRFSDSFIGKIRGEIRLNMSLIVQLCIVIFVVFGLVVLYTAKNIPLLNAFRGASESDLSLQRSDLSKLREGWEISLVYINAMLTTSIAPFIIAYLFLNRTKSRWFFTCVYILYCQASLEKALFIKGMLPLIYLNIIGKIGNWKIAVLIVIACGSLIGLNTFLARGGLGPPMVGTDVSQPALDFPSPSQPRSPEVSPGQSQQINPTTKLSFLSTIEWKKFFHSTYTAKSTAEYTIWRLWAVPIFTASDSLKVLDTTFNAKQLFGATSAPIAALILRTARVPFEAIVHGYQWGNGTASLNGRSNTVFFIEAFVNFGWLGVFCFSFFVRP